MDAMHKTCFLDQFSQVAQLDVVVTSEGHFVLSLPADQLCKGGSSELDLLLLIFDLSNLNIPTMIFHYEGNKIVARLDSVNLSFKSAWRTISSSLWASIASKEGAV